VGALLVAARDEGDLVVDGGSGLSAPTLAAVHHADVILVVTPPTLAGARRALRLREALSDVGARGPTLVVNQGAGPLELGASAVGVAIGVPVLAVLPYAVREAGEIMAGRRPRSRRGGLVDVLDAVATSLAGPGL
jgi:MinD superfamily P-loop ATPase